MKKICYVVGASDVDDLYLAPQYDRFVIAADGGLSHLEKRGIVPDLVVGDFDSLGRVPTEGEIIRHPPEKDDTDTVLAVREGMSRGCETFVLYGGLGGRLDHTYANIQTLRYLADCGATGYLLGGGTAVTVIKNCSMEFDKKQSGMLSVFCSGDRAEGICLEGLKYPLHDAVLTAGMPLGVSNEFLGVPSRITVENGVLIVMWSALPEQVLEKLPR